jgi:hypothetical protein
MKLLEQLNELGFERTRRALSAFALSSFVFLYLFVALLLSLNGMPAWAPAFIGLAACYGVAFMGVTAEWFWGRWFAEGLGWSGFMIAVASLVMGGQWNPILAAFGALHGLIVLMLAGKKMAARYDEQPAWRQRYAMDEFGVARLRKTVTRASASLPSVILWALGPKDPGEGMLIVVSTVAAGLLVVVGLGAVVRLRTWGVLAMGAAAVTFGALGSPSFPHFAWQSCFSHYEGPYRVYSVMSGDGAIWPWHLTHAGPGLPLALLAAALVPFAGPLVRHLSRRSRA